MHFRIVAALRMRLQSQIANQLLRTRMHGDGAYDAETQRLKLKITIFEENSLRLCRLCVRFRFQGMITIGARQKVAFAPVGSSTDTWQS